MPQFSADAKHAILLEYQPRSRTHSFAALAARHGVVGGKRTVQRWFEQWDGTVRSLQHKKGAGRPRALSRAQVSRDVREPILAANRAHRAVHYTQLLPRAQQASRTNLSLRTLQRYGKQELGVKQKHGTKRTADESEPTHAHRSRVALLFVEHGADTRLQCLLSCVSRSLRCVASSGV